MQSRKNSDKHTERSIMDEAPLFAGLEGCVIQQLEKPATVKPKKTAPPKEKQKNAKASPAETTPQPAPKSTKKPREQKPTTLDSEAILLSIREMCLLLKISRATLVRMDNAGKIPGRMKLGGSVRFHRATVVAWLESMISAPVPF